MPQLHRTAQMRKHLIQEPRDHQLERGFTVRSVEADGHQSGSPSWHHRTNDVTQAGVPPSGTRP
jgi:hypothetical protein